MSEEVKQERTEITFIHYITKEARTVEEPTHLRQFNNEFITAFMTSEEHYEDLEWFRGVRDAAVEDVKGEVVGDANIQIKAFPRIRKEFVKKYYPALAPVEKEPREKKPEKLSMWNI